ncbi:MAG: GWxTD domain-containing protein [candidate division KSB1 bacterium]|nr:GWxTD domain-containing protein [candidate division KSB1 bacterium]
MRRLLLMALGMWVWASSLAQQPQAPAGERRLVPFDVDFARFRGAGERIYLESYLWVSRAKLHYVPTEEGRYSGGFTVDIKAIQGDTVAREVRWERLDLIDSLGQAREEIRIPSVVPLQLEPGDYRLLVTVRDRTDTLAQGQWLSNRVHLESFPGDSLALSDIQFATAIRSADFESEFVKNGLFVQPNPTAVFGTGLEVMYFYTEVYNLDTRPGADSTYTVRYRILDADGNQIRSYPPRTKVKRASSVAEIGGLNVISLKSGPYYLFVDVTDNATGSQASTFKKFYVFRTGDYTEEQLAEARQRAEQQESGGGSPGTDAQRYDVMPEKELDKEFDYARYIATEEEKKVWKGLNLEGKRRFLKEFWAKRDQTPGTPANEFKRDYLQLVEMANRNFGGFREGYKTDRGRVLLTYGKPDEIERYPFSMDRRAYEVWHYYSLQGGVLFVFVDKREMGTYELVHSTARGEIYDPEWERWLDPNR